MTSLRSPWHHEPRIRLTDQERAKLFLERHGCCRDCGRKLGPADDWIVEHIIALENGGTNDRGNLGITCAWCKPKKDAEDHGTASRSRKAVTRHVIPGSQRKKSALAKTTGMKYDWQKGRYVRESET